MTKKSKKSEMGVLAHSGTEAGGNANSPAKRDRHRRYILRLSNWTNREKEELIYFITSVNGTYGIGEEICPSTGTPHLQGWCTFENPIEWDTMVGHNKRIHWEVMKRSVKANRNYCKKECKYVTNEIGYRELSPIRLITKLYPWQQKVVDEIKQEPDDRKIIWYWDGDGCKGKTQLVKYIAFHNQDRCRFSTTNKSSDIVTLADPFIKIYLFNFTRTTEGFCPMMALEALKDGLVSDGKLKKEMKQVIMNSPHIYVFANYAPDRNKMTADRWDIRRIDE